MFPGYLSSMLLLYNFSIVVHPATKKPKILPSFFSQFNRYFLPTYNWEHENKMKSRECLDLNKLLYSSSRKSLFMQVRRIILKETQNFLEPNLFLRRNKSPVFRLKFLYWHDIFVQLEKDISNEDRRKSTRLDKALMKADPVFWLGALAGSWKHRSLFYTEKSNFFPDQLFVLFCEIYNIFYSDSILFTLLIQSQITLQPVPLVARNFWVLSKSLAEWNKVFFPWFTFCFVWWTCFLRRFARQRRFVFAELPVTGIDYNILEFTDGIYLLQEQSFLPRPQVLTKFFQNKQYNYHQFYSLLWEQRNFTFVYCGKSLHNLQLPRRWLKLNYIFTYERGIIFNFRAIVWNLQYITGPTKYTKKKLKWMRFLKNKRYLRPYLRVRYQPWHLVRITFALQQTLERELIQILVYCSKHLALKNTSKQDTHPRVSTLIKKYTGWC